MKILGLDGKALENVGKVILPPSAGSGVDIQTNTITPDMYTVDLNNRTCYLNLNGLINHKFCVVQMTFTGEALDNNNVETTGDEQEYQVNIQYVSEDEDSISNYGMYCGPFRDMFGAYFFPIPITGTDYTFNLSGVLESTKNETMYGAALSISEIQFSSIISWD